MIIRTFLSQLIQFYSNNEDKSSPRITAYCVKTHAVLPWSIEIVMWPQITVTPLYPVYIPQLKQWSYPQCDRCKYDTNVSACVEVKTRWPSEAVKTQMAECIWIISQMSLTAAAITNGLAPVFMTAPRCRRLSRWTRRFLSITHPSSCSWWVSTYVGKPSATGQPTGPTQPFILSESINE